MIDHKDFSDVKQLNEWVDSHYDGEAKKSTYQPDLRIICIESIRSDGWDFIVRCWYAWD